MADQHAKGTVSKAKGIDKEVVGKRTNDQGLKAEGTTQTDQGDLEEAVGDAPAHGRRERRTEA